MEYYTALEKNDQPLCLDMEQSLSYYKRGKILLQDSVYACNMHTFFLKEYTGNLDVATSGGRWVEKRETFNFQLIIYLSVLIDVFSHDMILFNLNKLFFLEQAKQQKTIKNMKNTQMWANNE